MRTSDAVGITILWRGAALVKFIGALLRNVGPVLTGARPVGTSAQVMYVGIALGLTFRRSDFLQGEKGSRRFD